MPRERGPGERPARVDAVLVTGEPKPARLLWRPTRTEWPACLRAGLRRVMTYRERASVLAWRTLLGEAVVDVPLAARLQRAAPAEIRRRGSARLVNVYPVTSWRRCVGCGSRTSCPVGVGSEEHRERGDDRHKQPSGITASSASMSMCSHPGSSKCSIRKRGPAFQPNTAQVFPQYHSKRW